jgi:hypothetical protein
MTEDGNSAPPPSKGNVCVVYVWCQHIIANCPKSISFDVSVHDGAHWQASIRYSAVWVNQKMSGISHVKSQKSQEERRGGEGNVKPTNEATSTKRKPSKKVLSCQLQLSER